MARNPNLPEEYFDELWETKNITILSNLVLNPNLPEEYFEKIIARDKNHFMSNSIVRNPNLPEKYLKQQLKFTIMNPFELQRLYTRIYLRNYKPKPKTASAKTYQILKFAKIYNNISLW